MIGRSKAGLDRGAPLGLVIELHVRVQRAKVAPRVVCCAGAKIHIPVVAQPVFLVRHFVPLVVDRPPPFTVAEEAENHSPEVFKYLSVAGWRLVVNAGASPGPVSKHCGLVL